MGGLMQLVSYGTHYLNNHSIYSSINNFNTHLYEDTNVIKEWLFEYRLILDTDRNKDCPVTMEPINSSDTYCICSGCKYNFSKFAIDNIAKNKFNFSCPMCRTGWSDFTYYKNENFEDEIINAIREL